MATAAELCCRAACRAERSASLLLPPPRSSESCRVRLKAGSSHASRWAVCSNTSRQLACRPKLPNGLACCSGATTARWMKPGGAAVPLCGTAAAGATLLPRLRACPPTKAPPRHAADSRARCSSALACRGRGRAAGAAKAGHAAAGPGAARRAALAAPGADPAPRCIGRAIPPSCCLLVWGVAGQGLREERREGFGALGRPGLAPACLVHAIMVVLMAVSMAVLRWQVCD